MQTDERLYLEGLPELGIERTSLPNMPELIARHKGRYHLARAFCRPGMYVLDFPCGSGYGSEILLDAGIYYTGVEYSTTALAYCRARYAHPMVQFIFGDLRNPRLLSDGYDVIACIEGIEHIAQEFQSPLIESFYQALVQGGILIVSTPKRETMENPYHEHELSSAEFYGLLTSHFEDVQVLYHPDKDHTGRKMTQMFGICQRREDGSNR